MKLFHFKLNDRAQLGIEYLLILTVIAIIVLFAFKGEGLLGKIYKSQSPESSPNGYFSQATRVIQGEKPLPIHGGVCPGTNTCECPAPAFGGNDC
jgi:hypothetical protein